MKPYFYVLILLIIAAFGCNESGNEFFKDNDLLGEWQIYESGYSPGGGYVIDEVPADPLRYVRFGEDQEFESNYEGLEGVHFYSIVEENGRPTLHLYQNEPGDRVPGDQQMAYKYRMAMDKDKMKLMYSYCIEGCHIGLRRFE